MVFLDRVRGGDRAVGFIVHLDARIAYIMTVRHIIRGEKETRDHRVRIKFPHTNKTTPAEVVSMLITPRDREGGKDGMLLLRAKIPGAVRNLDTITLNNPTAMEFSEDFSQTLPGLKYSLPNSIFRPVKYLNIERADSFSYKVKSQEKRIKKGHSGSPLFFKNHFMGALIKQDGRVIHPLLAILLKDRTLPSSSITDLRKCKRTKSPVARNGKFHLPDKGSQFYISDLLKEFKYIPAGIFTMGGRYILDPDGKVDELPQRKVRVNGFFMQKWEVSLSEYESFLKNPRATCGRKKDTEQEYKKASDLCAFINSRSTSHPVACITWSEADCFCKAQGGRLPTEAEWEYAARGGIAHGIYIQDYQGRTQESHVLDSAGTLPNPSSYSRRFRNGYGLFHMGGNLAEWTLDSYEQCAYNLCKRGSESSVFYNPRFLDEGNNRKVIRGGAWSLPKHKSRIASRSFRDKRNQRYPDVGFRCVLDLEKVVKPASKHSK